MRVFLALMLILFQAQTLFAQGNEGSADASSLVLEDGASAAPDPRRPNYMFTHTSPQEAWNLKNIIFRDDPKAPLNELDSKSHH